MAGNMDGRCVSTGCAGVLLFHPKVLIFSRYISLPWHDKVFFYHRSERHSFRKFAPVIPVPAGCGPDWTRGGAVAYVTA